MKTLFDGENGMCVKKSYQGQHVDINVVVKLRKTRPHRKQAKIMEESIVEFSRFPAFLSASHNPRARPCLVLARVL